MAMELLNYLYHKFKNSLNHLLYRTRPEFVRPFENFQARVNRLCKDNRYMSFEILVDPPLGSEADTTRVIGRLNLGIGLRVSVHLCHKIANTANRFLVASKFAEFYRGPWNFYLVTSTR